MKQYLSTTTGIIRPPINFTTISRACQRCKMRPVKQETKKKQRGGCFASVVPRGAGRSPVGCRAVRVPVRRRLFRRPRVGRLSAVGRGLFLFHCTTKSPFHRVHGVGLSIHGRGRARNSAGAVSVGRVYFAGVAFFAVAFFAGCFALFFFACSRSRFACSRFASCSFLRCSRKRAFSSCCRAYALSVGVCRAVDTIHPKSDRKNSFSLNCLFPRAVVYLASRIARATVSGFTLSAILPKPASRIISRVSERCFSPSARVGSSGVAVAVRPTFSTVARAVVLFPFCAKKKKSKCYRSRLFYDFVLNSAPVIR